MTPYFVLDPKMLDTEGREQRAMQILSVIKDYYGKRSLSKLKVLDLGCSTGTITSYLSKYFGKVVGIDQDKESILNARKDFKKVKFIQMDASKMTFNSEAFDLVICHQISITKSKQERLFSEIRRVLKVGGGCFFEGSTNYFDFQELRNQMKDFQVTSFTGRIIKNPSRYGFKNLERYEFATKWVPVTLLDKLSPTVVWVLQKS